jgi:hypothetical protein
LETLSPYGTDYLNAGRSQKALKDIDGKDSDGDGFSNREEIADLKYPGLPRSRPGQKVAPRRELSLDELEALPSYREFLLANSHKQQCDTYATYTGIRIRDLLLAVGVDPDTESILGISVIAPDGYVKDFSVEEITKPFPAGRFYAGLDAATLGTDCMLVHYPEVLPQGLTDGGPIPDEQWLMLAYERDGLPMEPANLDITSGKIKGEGPLRMVVPQSQPGSPDRGSDYSPSRCNDGWDYDDSKDHNAGAMARGVVAIRINPLPEGYEDFDYRSGGWAYIDSRTLILYGHGITGP